jgi:hypothetical protein
MVKLLGSFTIGTDSECFLREGGQLKSAIPIIKGTKDKPITLANGAGLHHDNVAMEIAIPQTDNVVSFVRGIKKSFGLAKKIIPKKYAFSFDSSANFPAEELQDDTAHEFGCEPDFNAWTNDVNVFGENDNAYLRSCGSHIHVGYIKGSENYFLRTDGGKGRLIKAMDCMLGIVSVILDNSPESKERRKLYGKAGAHRPKSYGVEYRTLSNFWMKDDRLIKMVYYLTKDSVEICRQGKYDALFKAVGDKVQDVINMGEIEEAKRIVENTTSQFMSARSKLIVKELVDEYSSK